VKYLISYDLLKPGQNYDNLVKALTQLGANRILLSQWIIRHNSTSSATLRDYVRQHVDANDRVLVNCLDTADWAGWNLMVDPNKM